MYKFLGKPHPQYGGIVTDIRDLPVGATFHVNNGAWNGVILDKNKIGVYTPNGLKCYNIDNEKSILALSEINYKLNDKENL